MSVAPPAVAGTHRLDAREASSLWQHVLQRQGLGSRPGFTSIPAITDATLGLHAARLPSPYATVLARAATTDVALGLWAEATHRKLITLRCMRRTLHTLPLELAGSAHIATLHYRERDALRRIMNAGCPDRLITELTRRIEDLLGEHGHLGHRQIEDRLTGAAPYAVRLALKLAWERGTLAYRNRSGGWNREVRTFALTATTHPELDLAVGRHSATSHLIEAYFERYGPASLRDATWWSGLSRGAIVDALDRVGRPLIEVLTPWAAAPVYLFRDRFDEFTSAGPAPSPTRVHFLAHEDVALKAYAETRTRYLGEVAECAAFNRIGEALPAVLIGGQVVATWSWDVRRHEVRYAYHRSRTGSLDREAIRAEAKRVTLGLRRGYDAGRVNSANAGLRPELVASAAP
ncbi:crosslink repair DNA glycosylase YcaQ family protein [Actinoplanes sp. NPDC051851]|uniref:DNA glycosylase AlkZ-like family protein n=1 Tax=Actinoplanes sp. NPDC051851 TaxID=3154753 RepID=UPI00343E0D8B